MTAGRHRYPAKSTPRTHRGSKAADSSHPPSKEKKKYAFAQASPDRYGRHRRGDGHNRAVRSEPQAGGDVVGERAAVNGKAHEDTLTVTGTSESDTLALDADDPKIFVVDTGSDGLTLESPQTLKCQSTRKGKRKSHRKQRSDTSNTGRSACARDRGPAGTRQSSILARAPNV
jgi:hypothetical protein